MRIRGLGGGGGGGGGRAARFVEFNRGWGIIGILENHSAINRKTSVYSCPVVVFVSVTELSNDF